MAIDPDAIDRKSGPGGEAIAFLFANGGGEVIRLGSGGFELVDPT